MNTPLFRLALFCVFAFATGPLHADEALRRVQQSLRDQGFYYGSIDGAPGDETTQAIRRYQIRNGLAVTGQLNDETRQSIERTGMASKGSGSTAARPSRPVTVPSTEDDRRSTTGRATVEPTPPPLSRPPVVAARPPESSINRPVPNDEDEDDAPASRPAPPISNHRPDLRVSPLPPNNIPPPPPRLPYGAVPPSPTLTSLFASTPYEFAPPAVQSDILRRAQYALARSGFYGGQVDGAPGAMTGQALAEFQSVNGLRRTGRLDVSTLGYLRLLPGRQTVAPRPAYGGQRPPRIIFEGRIVE